MSTVFLIFLDNHRSLSSPVSIFQTDSTKLSTDKGRKHSDARISDDDFRRVSSPHAKHDHSVSQFSRQPPIPFESRFDFPDRLDPYQLMQRPKTFRRANRRRRFPRRVSSPHAVREHSISQFSRQPPTPFESRFDFPDQIDPYQLMQRPKTFSRANRRRRFPAGLQSSC